MYRFIDTDGSHAHVLDGSPLYGTSTVCGILSKELTYWASGMAVGTLGWTATKADPDMRLETAKTALEGIKQLDAAEYLKRLDKAYKAHATAKNKAADKGVSLHSRLEEYVKRMITDFDGKPHLLNDSEKEDKEWEKVQAFAKWATENVDTFLWSEGHTYSKEHHLGGIVDAGAKMKNGRMAIIDFKSAKMVYYGHMIQCAGYAIQVEETGIVTSGGKEVLPPMKIDELIVIPFGAENMEPRSVQNVAGFQEAFLGALVNYKLKQAFEANV